MDRAGQTWWEIEHRGSTVTYTVLRSCPDAVGFRYDVLIVVGGFLRVGGVTTELREGETSRFDEHSDMPWEKMATLRRIA